MSVLKVPVTSADHIQGDERAPATLVEYGDYEGGYCGLAFPIVKSVQNHFGKKLKFVFRHFPLTQVHPLAQPAAETAEFAGAHGRFWQMHDSIFENQGRWPAARGAVRLRTPCRRDRTLSLAHKGIGVTLTKLRRK